MVVELLYPEIANLLGEHGHLMLFRRLFAGDTILETPVGELPAFLEQDVDFVFMGPMSEGNQARTAALWSPFATVFKRRFADGVRTLFTGNSLDLLGERIVHEGGDIVKGLGLIPFETTVRRYDRRNDFVWGHYEELPIFGPRSQFTLHGGRIDPDSLFTLEEGAGTVPGERGEGIRYRNVMATELLGPLLIANPRLTQKLFPDRELPFTDALLKANAQRFADHQALAAEQK